MFRRFLAGYDVSTHSRLKAAGRRPDRRASFVRVSTHSRLKAAGLGNLKEEMELCGFNTQPPEGGWFVKLD